MYTCYSYYIIPPMTLSVCMIVKDEEQTLARCLDCVLPFADEIVVVDTGSSDKTVDIAKSFTENVYHFEWCDDFSAARNFSFSKAACDYIMWIDADDVITEENAVKIADLKSVEFDTAFIKYAASFDGGKPSFVYYRERIFRRLSRPKWEGEVHECVAPAGKIIYSDACIYHKKLKSNPAARNLRIYQGLISRGRKLTGRQQFYYGRELYFNALYLECIAVLNDFLSGEGWVENKIEACRTLYYAYMAIGQTAEAVNCILKSFTFAVPRAQDCCLLAGYFESKGVVEEAIYWYKHALNSEEDLKSGGFMNTDYLTFIPAIRLCVLYDGLGNYALASHYNDIAGECKPDNPAYLYNKNYFRTKLNEG